MIYKYRKECLVIAGVLLLCFISFSSIKAIYFSDRKVNEPIENVINYYNDNDKQNANYVVATTKLITTTFSFMNDQVLIKDEEIINAKVEEVTEYPYSVAPTFEEDGSIIFEGKTLTEITNQLNKSLDGYLTNTGYFFAKFTKDTGMDPYLSVAIVLLETGCKWNCSNLTTKCNNIGGLKGDPSCNGGSYRKYDTLGEGIEGYLNIIYKNYYLQGLDTPEKMHSKYASSSEWANKVNGYIVEVKSK